MYNIKTDIYIDCEIKMRRMIRVLLGIIRLRIFSLNNYKHANYTIVFKNIIKRFIMD